ncbi:adenosine receptor A2b [Heptranchias perlo]|uniref:adenosine receptor A2b n=1 Tax=Heptranchias perlo TaxID=212740 RepID=UPI003559E41C
MEVSWPYVALELLMAVLATLGNLLVCWAVSANRRLRTATNYFLVSLAVADIAVGSFAIPTAIIISIGFSTHFLRCLFLVCFVLVPTQSSIFSLLAVAIDRYLTISIHLRYKGLITGRRARLIIAVFWILSLVIGLTPFLGWNQWHVAEKGCPNITDMALNPGNDSCLWDCSVKCLFLNVVDMNYMVYFNFLGCVLTPLLIMLGIYVKIFTVARKQLRKIELNSVNSDSSRTYLQNQVRVAKSLSIIVGFFAFCWLPLHILNCINHFHPQYFNTMDPRIMNAAIILSHTNSVGNPIIYAYRLQEFRMTFHKIIFKHILCKTDNDFKYDNRTLQRSAHLKPTEMAT